MMSLALETYSTSSSLLLWVSTCCLAFTLSSIPSGDCTGLACLLRCVSSSSRSTPFMSLRLSCSGCVRSWRITMSCLDRTIWLTTSMRRGFRKTSRCSVLLPCSLQVSYWRLLDSLIPSLDTSYSPLFASSSALSWKIQRQKCRLKSWVLSWPLAWILSWST